MQPTAGAIYAWGLELPRTPPIWMHVELDSKAAPELVPGADLAAWVVVGTAPPAIH